MSAVGRSGRLRVGGTLYIVVYSIIPLYVVA